MKVYSTMQALIGQILGVSSDTSTRKEYLTGIHDYKSGRVGQHTSLVQAYQVGTDTSEAGGTVRTIVASSHAALKGDIISFTSGAFKDIQAPVIAVETNNIHLGFNLPSAIGASI